MKTNRFNALAAAVAVLAGAACFSAQAQVAPSAPAAVPNQNGVVYPGRAMEPSAPPAPTYAAPSAPAAYAPAGAVPVPGTLLPGQTRAVAPAGSMPTGFAGNLPAGSPPNVLVQPQASANVAPAMPPLPGATAPKNNEPLKTPAQLALEDTLPNVSAEVRELRRRMDETTRAATANPGVAPRPVTRSIPITQAAGEEPPAIRTALSMPTNLVFTDTTGAPWPIEFATPGDNSQFDVLLPVVGTSTVQIRPKVPNAYAGLSITLKGNSVPITVILAAAQKEVDNRVDVRVMQRGPNAIAPMVDRVVTGSSAASDSALISFLDGVPPSGAKEVRTSMRGMKGWILNDQLYLRTDTTLVSPLWTDSVSSPNGVTRAYLLSNVPAVVISDDGRMVSVTIGE